MISIRRSSSIIHIREKYRKEEVETENVPEDLAELSELSMDSKVNVMRLKQNSLMLKLLEM